MSSTEESSDDVPSWKVMVDKSSKKARKIKGGNYVQIATVEKCEEENVWKPRCRTVVFRGFTNRQADGTIGMKMITDARSGKVEHILRNPHGEMVWWFPLSSEQYRFQGKFKLIYPVDHSRESSNSQEEDKSWAGERLDSWNKLSQPAKEQFFWPQPGVNYTGLQEASSDEVTEEPSSTSNQDTPPSTFLLLLLFPTSVHYLRLKDNYATRDTLGQDGRWLCQRVNP